MKKGYRFERELVEKFWKIGFAAVRVPASGTYSHPSPDVIAGNGFKYYAVQVKMRSKLPVYIERRDVEELIKFSKTFGAEPLIAVRLPYRGWRFIRPEDLKEAGRGYKVDEMIYEMGSDFDELLRGLRQKRLDEGF